MLHEHTQVCSGPALRNQFVMFKGLYLKMSRLYEDGSWTIMKYNSYHI